MTQADSTRNIRTIPLDLVVPSAFQVRLAHDEDALAQLTASLRVHGLLQPIVVREITQQVIVRDPTPRPGGEAITVSLPVHYEAIAGHRRVMAARALGWSEIAALVRDADAATAAALTIEENLQRKDLSPIEVATALKRYIDTFGVTQSAVGERFGMAQETVSNYLRVLGLPDDIQALVKGGQLGVSHVKALIPLAEVNPKMAIKVAQESAEHRGSVKAVEDEVRWRVPIEKDKAERREERAAARPALDAKKKEALQALVKGLEELPQPVEAQGIRSHYYCGDKAGNVIPITFAPVVIDGQPYKLVQPSQDTPSEYNYAEPAIALQDAIRDRVDNPKECQTCPRRIVVRAFARTNRYPSDSQLEKPPVDHWCCADKNCRAAKIKVLEDRHRQQWEANTKSSLADLKTFLKAHQTSDDPQALALMLALDYRHDLKGALDMVKQVLAAPQNTFLSVLASRAEATAKAESMWHEARMTRNQVPPLRAILDAIAKPAKAGATQKGKAEVQP